MRMRWRLDLSAVALSVVMGGALAGCAVYEKCGVSGCPGDAEITAQVQALFVKHPELEPPNLLQVQTLNHVVYLTGVVDTDYERQMAEVVARQAPGVTNVINSIGLSGGR
jgi:hyperosmotically inducible protein